MSLVDKIDLTKEDRIKLSSILSNWVELSTALGSICDESVLLKLIKLELDSKKRVQMIYRIKSRFNTVRNKREMRELMNSL